MAHPDFDAWVAACGPALLRLAYTLTGNRSDAEDVVQEALARALPRWERISAVEDVDAYVRRMVVDGADAGVPPDERRALWLACQALPEAQRTAIVLCYYEQLEYAEIAAVTGVREGSVRSRVSRGLVVLRKELGHE